MAFVTATIILDIFDSFEILDSSGILDSLEINVESNDETAFFIMLMELFRMGRRRN